MYPLVRALDVMHLNTFTKLPALTRIYSKYRNKPNRHNAFIQYAEVYFCETAFFPCDCVFFLKVNLSASRSVTAELVCLSLLFALKYNLPVSLQTLNFSVISMKSQLHKQFFFSLFDK